MYLELLQPYFECVVCKDSGYCAVTSLHPQARQESTVRCKARLSWLHLVVRIPTGGITAQNVREQLGKGLGALVSVGFYPSSR